MKALTYTTDFLHFDKFYGEYGTNPESLLN